MAKKTASKTKRAKRQVRRRLAPVARITRRPVAADILPMAHGGNGDSTCILCQGSLAEHFGDGGRYVGCVGHKRGSDATMFLPPVVLISSAALLQASIEGQPENVRPFRAARRAESSVVRAGIAAMQNRLPSAGNPRGRRAENIFPTAKAIPADLAPNVQHVFSFLSKYRNAGITLKRLVEEMKMPYSTVQAQINKLVAMGAAKKELIAKAA